MRRTRWYQNDPRGGSHAGTSKERILKGIVAFVLFTQLMAVAAVLAAASMRRALGAHGVTPRKFLVTALQTWLPTAIQFVLTMNALLEKWAMHPLLAIPMLLLALLVLGIVHAWWLLSRSVGGPGKL